MKIRQRTTCHTCRSRKLACDGKQPACSQCVLRGRQCAGYKHDLIFVNQSPAADGAHRSLRHFNQISRPAPERRGSPRSPNISVDFSRKRVPDLRPSTWDLVIPVLAKEYAPDLRLFSSEYVSYGPKDCLCGMWVNTLHELPRSAAYEPIVTTAMTALGATILSRGPRRQLSEHQRVDSHISALRLLAKGLQAPRKSFSPELGVAIMCLSLAEMLSPTYSTAWMTHASGVSELLRLSGPDKFVSGMNHIIFLACRSMVIFYSFYSRKSTYLAHDSWQTIPFSAHPPSEMHQLLGVVAPIPALLEQLDVVKAHPHPVDFLAARDLRASFVTVFTALEKWTQHFHHRHKHAVPLYWRYTQLPPPSRAPHYPSLIPCPTTADAIGPDDDEEGNGDIWFPTLLTATVLTNIWTFRIIILTSLLTLDSLISAHSPLSPKASTTPPPSHSADRLAPPLECPHAATTTSNDHFPSSLTANARTTRANILRMALRIVQSMRYYMQTGTNFYGLSGASFPLKTAYEACLLLISSNDSEESGSDSESVMQQQEGEKEVKEGVRRCKSAMRELEERGYPYAPLFGGTNESTV